jgi:energy-coupling factor transport system permease protein
VITALYRREESVLHRLDPRIKLLNVLTLVVLFFLPLRPLHLGAYLAATTVLVAVVLGARELWRPVRVILPILVLVVVLTPPFHRGGATLVAIGNFPLVTEHGLREALRLAIRFTGITMVFYAYLRTTDPEQLVLSFRWFGLPFGAALVVNIALQYVPNIKVLYDQVQDAHRLRQPAPKNGGAHSRGRRRGVFRRLAFSIPALTSVLILSVRRIPVLAMVLEIRGVGRSNRRTTYRALPSGGLAARSALVGLGVEAILIASALMFP